MQKYAELCPFAFKDKYELWLLDKNNKEPLALLDSVCNETEIYTPDNLIWDAGLRCKQEFLQESSQTDKQLVTAGELLNQVINQRAGKRPSAQWFYRNRFNYGKGLTGVKLNHKLTGRELSARVEAMMLKSNQNKNTVSKYEPGTV